MSCEWELEKFLHDWTCSLGLLLHRRNLAADPRRSGVNMRNRDIPNKQSLTGFHLIRNIPSWPQKGELSTVDPWTTQVWATLVHLYKDFFFSINMYYSTMWSTIGWISKCRTMDKDGGLTVKLHTDFWPELGVCQHH